MPNLQEVFNRLQETKKEQRTIKSTYKDALATSQSYQQVIEKLQTLKEEKKKIEENIKSDFKSEFDKLDAIKLEIETDKLIMSDLALNEITKGNMIEIVDQYSNKYEPVFSVRFKKT